MLESPMGAGGIARRIIIAAAILGASAAVASASPKHVAKHPAHVAAQPEHAKQYYGLYDNPVRQLSDDQIDNHNYQRAGTRGREDLGESPYHPEGPGNVSD